MRAALMREACSIVDSTERKKNGRSSSLSTIVDVVGDKVANIIRQIVRDDANVRALRVQASSFVPEQGEDCRILNLNNHELEEREGSDGEGKMTTTTTTTTAAAALETINLIRSSSSFFYNALDDEYEGVNITEVDLNTSSGAKDQWRAKDQSRRQRVYKRSKRSELIRR